MFRQIRSMHSFKSLIHWHKTATSPSIAIRNIFNAARVSFGAPDRLRVEGFRAAATPLRADNTSQLIALWSPNSVSYGHSQSLGQSLLHLDVKKDDYEHKPVHGAAWIVGRCPEQVRKFESAKAFLRPFDDELVPERSLNLLASIGCPSGHRPTFHHVEVKRDSVQEELAQEGDMVAEGGMLDGKWAEQHGDHDRELMVQQEESRFLDFFIETDAFNHAVTHIGEVAADEAEEPSTGPSHQRAWNSVVTALRYAYGDDSVVTAVRSFPLQGTTVQISGAFGIDEGGHLSAMLLSDALIPESDLNNILGEVIESTLYLQRSRPVVSHSAVMMCSGLAENSFSQPLIKKFNYEVEALCRDAAYALMPSTARHLVTLRLEGFENDMRARRLAKNLLYDEGVMSALGDALQKHDPPSVDYARNERGRRLRDAIDVLHERSTEFMANSPSDPRPQSDVVVDVTLESGEPAVRQRMEPIVLTPPTAPQIMAPSGTTDLDAAAAVMMANERHSVIRLQAKHGFDIGHASAILAL
ncbi:MAG: hypothetical protein MHM6MM_000699 [Cercozoa sp. M6MM]